MFHQICEKKENECFIVTYERGIFIIVCHLSIFLFMKSCLLLMIIVLILWQVSTRFLSASPPIYWFASYTMLSPDRNLAKWRYLISTYFIAYILLGALLFSNFYPFTWGTGLYWIQQQVDFSDNIINFLEMSNVLAIFQFEGFKVLFL